MNLPDPSWDYSPLYTHLLLAKSALENAIATVSKAETANDATDSALIELLETLQGEASNALKCLHHKTDLSKFNAAYEALSPEYQEKWDDIVVNHPWFE
ncbi:MAG: hypothetical protein PT118_18465 [Aphanizomenon gracile PMC644.10]|nr:hypothetical protein [Aphanizomenon gracile PMC644.10]